MKTVVARKEDEINSRKRRKCLRKFLYYFPGGYSGKKFIEWEREYKWNAHLSWKEKLNRKQFEELLEKEEYSEIAKRAVNIESRTNLLFSFEKMAIRDAVKSKQGAEQFASGLFDYLYSGDHLQQRFENFVQVISHLPRKQTRVLTWPLLTVFGFIAEPETHIFFETKGYTKRCREI